MSSLLRIQSRYAGSCPPTTELHLTFDARQKSRFRSTLSDGREVAVILPRGQSLRDGDLLEADDGSVVAVHALPETVSRVASDDLLLLCRAAYHLGNRHMPVQIAPGELRYHHDHVLDDMLRHLGLEPEMAQLPFEPESGAYGSGHSFASHPHHHGHSRGHGHSHAHVHSHAHGQHHGVFLETAPRSTGVIHVNWESLDVAEPHK